MAENYLLIFRKPSNVFFSIENVFYSLKPFLNSESVQLPNDSKGILNLLKNIVFLIRVSRNKNVVHVTGHDHYLLWFKYKKKTILTIHDIEALKRKRGLKKRVFKTLWFDIPIRNADIITTISEFSKRELLSNFKIKKPIIVIPNPLSIKIHRTVSDFHIDCPRILHIGTKKNKNLKRTIQALDGINCILMIIGGINTEIERLLVKHEIKFTSKSNLTSSEIVEEYKKCDMLSFVSTYEGFGLPIIEAQATGRPVLTSNCSSMPEVAGEGALLVDPFSISEIRSGIERIISDQELRSNLISKGFDNIKRFDANEIAGQYLKLYNDILEKDIN